MELKPIDLPELVGVTLGMILVIIPVLGATIRFAARPFVEALISSGLLRRNEVAATDNGKLVRRIQELELEVALLKTSRDIEPVRSRVS